MTTGISLLRQPTHALVAALTRFGWARSRLRPGVLLALAAVYLIWGSTYLAMRWSLESFAPFRMAGLRFSIAGGILFVLLRARGAPKPSLREWGASVLAGGLLLTCGNGLVVLAEQSVSTSFAAISISTVPLWTAVLSGLVGERPSRSEWAGIAVGFLGALALNAGSGFGAGSNGVSGAAVAILGAPVAWAMGLVIGRRVGLPGGGMAAATQMLGGGAIALTVSFMIGESSPGPLTLRASAAFAYLVVAGSLIGFSAFQYLVQRTRPAVATSYAYVNPLVAAVLGIVLEGESIAPLTWIAGAIIASSLLLLSAAPGHPFKKLSRIMSPSWWASQGASNERPLR